MRSKFQVEHIPIPHTRLMRTGVVCWDCGYEYAGPVCTWCGYGDPRLPPGVRRVKPPPLSVYPARRRVA